MTGSVRGTIPQYCRLQQAVRALNRRPGEVMLLGLASLCLSRDNRNTLCYCVRLLDFYCIALALTLAPAIGCLPALLFSQIKKVFYCSVQWIRSEFIRLTHYFHLHSALLSNLQALFAPPVLAT